MSDLPSDEYDPDWQAALKKPATRAELLSVLQMTHLALLSHSLFEAALVSEAREEDLRLYGERTIDAANHLMQKMRTLTDAWGAERE